jgi:hypothetical protein
MGFGGSWVAEVKDRAFVAACGPLDLPKVLTVFRDRVVTAVTGHDATDGQRPVADPLSAT